MYTKTIYFLISISVYGLFPYTLYLMPYTFFLLYNASSLKL